MTLAQHAIRYARINRTLHGVAADHRASPTRASRVAVLALVWDRMDARRAWLAEQARHCSGWEPVLPERAVFVPVRRAA